jgi:cell division protein FtsA
MQEILDFVVYHLKQVGLDNKLLNGGIILTGGGSQLKHLIQLTEYVTGINARIGYPNEHLASGHIEELAKPMYATCIGLILKGYNDFENAMKLNEDQFVRLHPAEHKRRHAAEIERDETEDRTEVKEKMRVNTKPRKSLKEFMDSMKKGLIDLFREEDDAHFN